MEFFEQFNENLLIKSHNRPLQIYNVIKQKKINVEGFETPDAFFFLYEKEIIVSVSEGKILLYRIEDGKLMTDFG